MGEELAVREITDSFTLSAEMDSSSALDNPAVARLIRTVVSRFQGRRGCESVQPI